jgi:hypothetical protein
MEFELRDGREVLLKGLAAVETYQSALEGSLEELSSLYRRQGLAKWVARVGHFSDCSGIQVLDPGTPELPPVLCVAYLKMFDPGQSENVFFSHLLVGWYADDFDDVLRSVASVMKKVDWDAHAEDILYEDL